jgi:antitoxin (DNA-binding transcriptional repressor) of toxin-antitoxin stability system
MHHLMNVRQISISEFKAHCTEEMREVEKGNVILQVTRHGKTIAVVGKPVEEPIAPLLGAGKATATLNESYDPHAPAFDEEDWEMNR